MEKIIVVKDIVIRLKNSDRFTGDKYVFTKTCMVNRVKIQM